MTCTADTLHRDAVVSLSRAARALPMREGDALAVLRERGLVRDLVGRSVVIWGEVLDALAAGLLGSNPPAAAKPARRRNPPPRISLL